MRSATQSTETKSYLNLLRASIYCIIWCQTCTETGLKLTNQVVSTSTFTTIAWSRTRDLKAPASTTWWASKMGRYQSTHRTRSFSLNSTLYHSISWLRSRKRRRHRKSLPSNTRSIRLSYSGRRRTRQSATSASLTAKNTFTWRKSTSQWRWWTRWSRRRQVPTTSKRTLFRGRILYLA